MCEQETGIPLTGQRLVYKGEVLGAGTVSECGVSEDDFLVVVVVRSGAPPPTASPPPVLLHQRQQLPEEFSAGGSGGDGGGMEAPPALETVPPVELADLMQALATLGGTDLLRGLQAQRSARERQVNL